MASIYKSLFFIVYCIGGGVYLPLIHPIWNFIKYEYWIIISHKRKNILFIIPITILFLWLHIHTCTSLYVIIIINLNYQHHLLTYKCTTEVSPFLCHYFHFTLGIFNTLFVSPHPSPLYCTIYDAIII